MIRTSKPGPNDANEIRTISRDTFELCRKYLFWGKIMPMFYELLKNTSARRLQSNAQLTGASYSAYAHTCSFKTDLVSDRCKPGFNK